MIITESDLMMDDNGQPVISAAGESLMVSGIDCFLQNVRNEAVTMEGECFWDADYGWSMLDFIQQERDELLQTRISNRVKQKLSRRSEINQQSITVVVSFLDDDVTAVKVAFKIKNSDVSYEIDLNVDGVETEVVLVD